MTTFTPTANPNTPQSLTLIDILKTFNSLTGKEFSTRWQNVNDLLSPHIEPTFEHIQDSPYTNEELATILNELTKSILVNSKEIIYLKHLIALVTFELLEQGIELPDKELMQNLKIYLKYK